MAHLDAYSSSRHRDAQRIYSLGERDSARCREALRGGERASKRRLGTRARPALAARRQQHIPGLAHGERRRSHPRDLVRVWTSRALSAAEKHKAANDCAALGAPKRDSLSPLFDSNIDLDSLTVNGVALIHSILPGYGHRKCGWAHQGPKDQQAQSCLDVAATAGLKVPYVSRNWKLAEHPVRAFGLRGEAQAFALAGA